MKHIEKVREALDEAETVLLRCEEHTTADACRRAIRALSAIEADVRELVGFASALLMQDREEHGDGYSEITTPTELLDGLRAILSKFTEAQS